MIDEKNLLKQAKEMIRKIHWNNQNIMDDIESISNDVFISMWKADEKKRFNIDIVQSNFEDWKGYLFLTVRNECFKYLNQLKKERDNVSIEDSLGDTNTPICSMAPVSDFKAILPMLLTKPKYKMCEKSKAVYEQVINLLVEGYQIFEIAKITNHTSQHIRNVIEDIRTKLLANGYGRNYTVKFKREKHELSEDEVMFKSKALVQYGINEKEYRAIVLKIKSLDSRVYKVDGMPGTIALFDLNLFDKRFKEWKENREANLSRKRKRLKAIR